MAVWNTMFHRAQAIRGRTPLATCSGIAAPISSRGSAIARACHSPRNALGAELKGADHLAGGEVEGWHAPPLNGSVACADRMDRAGLLRLPATRLFGRARRRRRPDGADRRRTQAAFRTTDIRAMARYLASLAPASPRLDPELRTRLEQAAKARASRSAYLAGARIYCGACAVCHEPGQGLAMFGVKPSLALNTAIHAETPDTVLRVILEGARPPSRPRRSRRHARLPASSRRRADRRSRRLSASALRAGKARLDQSRADGASPIARAGLDSCAACGINH